MNLEKQAGNALRRERTLRGWSQSDVAGKIGSSPKTVSRWERGIVSPGPHMRQQLSELYGKTVQELGLITAIGHASPDNIDESTDPSGIAPVPRLPEQELLPEQKQSTAVVATVQVSSQEQSASPQFNIPEQSKTQRPFHNIQQNKPALLLICSFLVLCIVFVSISRWSPWPWQAAATTRTVSLPPSNPYTGKGKLTLNDSLAQDTAAGWSTSNNSEGQCFFADNSYRIRSPNANYMKVCIASQTYFNNLTFEVQMQITAGDCGGLVLRSTFPLMYYFLICSDGHYRFTRYDRDNVQNRRIPASGISTAIHRGLNTTNSLAIVANLDTFSLYINHTLVAHATDTAYLDGQIGLIAHTCRIVYLDPRPNLCSAPTEVVFQHARVWSI